MDVSRQLRITGGDDVYTLTLAPADLVYLRPDLGDIRLVDSERRQVRTCSSRAPRRRAWRSLLEPRRR